MRIPLSLLVSLLLLTVGCGPKTPAENDMTTDADSFIYPDVEPSARLSTQLTWKEGVQTRHQLDGQTGVQVDLNLHLIKKQALDDGRQPTGELGRMCNRADDVSASLGDAYFVKWYAAADIDNDWGGGDYSNPENIQMGPIDDNEPRDGIPDVSPFSDDYLVVVNYAYCRNLASDGSTAPCEEGGEAYNVHGRVEIFIDGAKAPREGDDETLVRDFVIRPNEWMVLSRVTWNQSLTGTWPGSAVVHDAFVDYQICQFNTYDCKDVEIWDRAAYETWVMADPSIDPFTGGGGTCYPYGTRE